MAAERKYLGEPICQRKFSADPTALTFTDVSTAAGFFGLNLSWCAAWGDYDNDGNWT